MLRVYPLRLEFAARDTIRFPAGKPGNVLRGAFGHIFRNIVCDPACPGARTCEKRDSCPYARIFEPSASAPGPSGLADWPRPFVFRAGHLDGKTVRAGDNFHFDLNIFEMREPAIQHFTRAFAVLGDEGLGPGRGRANLSAVHQIAPDGSLTEPGLPLELNLNPPATEVQHLRVEFLTATELKAGKYLSERPEFRVLFSRARDRVSALCSLYQHGQPDLDFRGMGQRAAAVAMTRCEVNWRDAKRHSSRTGQVHPLGGFAGEAEYTGRIGEFVPILHAAQWTGVGRHTVWGKGVIRIAECAAASRTTQ